MRYYAIINIRVEYADEHPHAMPEHDYECVYFDAEDENEAFEYLKKARTIPEYSIGDGVLLRRSPETFFVHLPADPEDR